MFISTLSVKNFRPFGNGSAFTIGNMNIPNAVDEGTGLNVLVGENGCGKTTLLDALVLPLLEYKADSVDLGDFHDKDHTIEISILTNGNFSYAGTIPRTTYNGKGFEFEAKIRARGNSAYLSSMVVSDQRFIRADGETKPEDGRPDLRLKVDNPWKGPRFSENDILYLDKNRTFQIRSGTYNSTRFDRVMEDYNYQHLKTFIPMKDLDKAITDKILTFENTHLRSALDKFKDIYGEPVRLSVIDNHQPFKNAFFAYTKPDHHQIPLDDMGSGYEMIFTILYSYYLSRQSGKQLILLIDEPELHLHPNLQETFSKLLLEFSKDAQIFITTHSPLLVKQLMTSPKPLIKVLRTDSGAISESSIADRKLTYLSANEINYIAYQLPTEEYHNELYEELFGQHATATGIKNFDISYFQGVKNEPANYEWKGTPNQVSLHTYVRNQIHHRSTCGTATTVDIQTSIDKMRSFL